MLKKKNSIKLVYFSHKNLFIENKFNIHNIYDNINKMVNEIKNTMNQKILKFIEKCESWKVEIKNYHWSADNMAQHELCDDIASSISDFEDLVSEVEQSISGKIKLNGFTPDKAHETNLKAFVEDVISSSKDFLKELEGMGENYVGIKSECETFIGDMQRKLYLVNFTLKEELKNRLREKLTESMPKNLERHNEVDKFMGRKPKSIKARINQIYRIVKKYGIDSKIYHDENWQAISDYYRAISSLGCEVEMKPCGHVNNADSMMSDGGYCDYDEYDHMPRSKQYAIKIMFEDGMTISGYIKCMAAGSVANPFDRYDTCIVLWPKNNRMNENKEENMNKQIKLTEAELKQLVKESAIKVLTETPLNYDIDNFSGKWTKSEPSDEELALADVQGDYLDNPFNPPNSWDDDEWVDGDKDLENEYSWDLHDRLTKKTPMMSPVDRQHDIMDAAATRRDHAAYWTDSDDERGNRLMNKWINGDRNLDDLEDADFSYDPYKYNEGKEPVKVTESELKTIVKEATIKLINEIGDSLKGAYKIGKLAARQDHRDKEPLKSAKTLAHGLKSAPKNDNEYKTWTNAAKEGYSDGKKEFGNVEEGDSGIHIKDSKKGTFTAAANKHGESVQGFASKVLNNKDDYSPAMVKKANFAKNAKKFKH